MKHIFATLTLVLCTCLSATSQAQSYYDEEEGWDYDSLIKKLSSPEVSSTSYKDPFEDVKIHAGVGFTNTISTLYYSNGDKTNTAQRGVQVSLGIDLFSKTWLAEGTFRNFGETKYDNSFVSLKEFDLKLIYQTRFAPTWGFRLGGGLAARYLDVNYVGSEGKFSEQYDIPASVIQTGLMTYLTKGLSLGTDISLRNALIDETPEKTAFDFTLRLDGHF